MRYTNPQFYLFSYYYTLHTSSHPPLFASSAAKIAAPESVCAAILAEQLVSPKMHHRL
jgi:hypothetical protein